MTREQQQEQKKRARKRRGRGEGSIYFDESAGRWCATVSRGVDSKGKRRRKKVSGKTKQEVQAKLAKLQQQEPLAETSGLKVGDYLLRWLELCRPNIASTTYDRRESLVRLYLLPHLAPIRLDRLQALQIEQFYADLAKADTAPNARRDAAGMLVMALNCAVRLKLIPANPAHAVERPRIQRPREMLILDDDQVRLLLEAARAGRWYALFALAVGSGMRKGELLGLNWPDIDFNKGTVTVRRALAYSKAQGGLYLKEPKSRAGRRTIVLPPFVLDALAEHRKTALARGLAGAPVFCTTSGRHVFPGNLRCQVFLPLLKRAGLPAIRFHDLRHTHASSLLSKGKSIRAVAARLGHSKVEMTLRVYAHVLPNDDSTLATTLQAAYG